MPDYVALAAKQLGDHRASLLSQLARIEDAIAALAKVPETRDQLVLDTGSPPETPRHVPQPEEVVVRGRFSDVGLSEAVKMLLLERETLNVPDALQALKEGGFRTVSKHLSANVHTTLRRMAERQEAVKVENGYRAVREETKEPQQAS